MAINKRLIRTNDEAGGASFNTVTYTGNEVSGRQITGVGFQPDFVWIKDRGDGTHWHNLFDSVRGASERLFSNTTNAESFYNESLQSFDNDGFTVGLDPDVNRNGGGIVAWCWKAGGNSNTYNVDGVGYSTSAAAGISTTGSNVTLQGASINTEAGFSIITFAGGGAYPKKVPHGLGVVPKITISFTRDVANAPIVMTTVVNGTEDYLFLNSTAALTTSTRSADSSIFDIIYSDNANYVSYCFAEVAGFSKFGSYTGNGLPLGPTIDCGFEPAFVMVKRTNAADNWVIVDNKRGTSNSLFPDSSSQELSNFGAATFSSTGFTVNGASGGWNNSSSTYIYMAFANQF